MINPERICYTLTANGVPCRATAIRGQLCCFDHSPGGRRRARALARLRRRPLCVPLTIAELAALARRCHVTRYYSAVIAAAQAESATSRVAWVFDSSKRLGINCLLNPHRTPDTPLGGQVKICQTTPPSAPESHLAGVSMRSIVRALAVSTLALTLTGGIAFAQDDHHDDQHQQYVRHQEWKKGAHIRQEDWARGAQVDWHAHHLRQPPSGYEWRQIDGNFVLCNSDGVISTVVVAR